MKRLYDFMIITFGADGLLHICVSALLLLIFSGIIGPFFGVAFTLTIGVAKEIYWDGYLGNGSKQAKDIWCDIIGIFLGLLIFLIYI